MVAAGWRPDARTRSMFETDKINARIPDLSLPGFNTLGGNEQVQGFEADAPGPDH